MSRGALFRDQRGEREQRAESKEHRGGSEEDKQKERRADRKE